MGDGASERQKEPHCASSRVLPHTLPVGSWGREALDLLGSSMGSQQGKLPLSPAEGRAVKRDKLGQLFSAISLISCHEK